MRSRERDYTYLLLNLVPQHRLRPTLRRDVEMALASGKPEDLRRQSVLALEELCHNAYLERIGVRRSNGEVVAEYRRKGGRFHVTVTVPFEEWNRYVGPVVAESPGARAPAAEGPAAAPASADVELSGNGAVTARARPAPVPGVELASYLPEIAHIFSLVPKREPVLDQLDLLLGTIKRWFDLAGASMLLLEEIANLADVTAENIRTVPASALRANELYRTCIETGVQRSVPRDQTGSERGNGAEADWDYVGVAPIFGMGKVCGILELHFRPGVDEASRKRRLEAAGSLLRHAIEFNSQIENITSIDALTQVYNRHFYDSQVTIEIERATRSGNEVSMLLIDLDDFKQINDEMGHKKGDEALSAVADLIRKNLRKVDIPFRYGGEEFVILLPGTSEFESVHTAERLRRVIAEYAGFKDLRGWPRRISVSIGVSVFPNTAHSADELFNQADAAMYQAKQHGKNRVVLYRPDIIMEQA